MIRSTVGAPLLLGLVIVALCTPASTLGVTQVPGAQVVEINAERFSFTPSQIRTKVGVPLEIRIRSDDTNHGFHILGTDVSIVVPKRGKGVITVRFTREAPGKYVFECSKLCGAGHDFMRGEIIVNE